MAQQVLPFYLVCDESGSMDGPPLQAINESLPKIHNEIGSHPAVADKTKFCLIGFSDSAQVLLPLSDLSAVASIPALQVVGGTSYSSAFDLLYDTIADDVQRLKANGDQVFRPAVFFLSDGQPGDNWEASYKRVTDRGWSLHPNVLAFGFGADRRGDAPAGRDREGVHRRRLDGTRRGAARVRAVAHPVHRELRLTSGSRRWSHPRCARRRSWLHRAPGRRDLTCPRTTGGHWRTAR